MEVAEEGVVLMSRCCGCERSETVEEEGKGERTAAGR